MLKDSRGGKEGYCLTVVTGREVTVKITGYVFMGGWELTGWIPEPGCLEEQYQITTSNIFLKAQDTIYFANGPLTFNYFSSATLKI